MVTYGELFQFCLVLIGVISLIVQIINKGCSNRKFSGVKKRPAAGSGA